MSNGTDTPDRQARDAIRNFCTAWTAGEGNDEFCEYPECGCIAVEIASIAVQAERRRCAGEWKDRLDGRMNSHLCEMQEGWDDSIVGFNDAWDVVRAFFAEIAEQIERGTP